MLLSIAEKQFNNKSVGVDKYHYSIKVHLICFFKVFQSQTNISYHDVSFTEKHISSLLLLICASSLVNIMKKVWILHIVTSKLAWIFSLFWTNYFEITDTEIQFRITENSPFWWIQILKKSVISMVGRSFFFSSNHSVWKNAQLVLHQEVWHRNRISCQVHRCLWHLYQVHLLVMTAPSKDRAKVLKIQLCNLELDKLQFIDLLMPASTFLIIILIILISGWFESNCTSMLKTA